VPAFFPTVFEHGEDSTNQRNGALAIIPQVNIRSTPQASVGMKLSLAQGLDCILTIGKVPWAEDQDLRAFTLFIPAVSLILHELAPVVQVNMSGIWLVELGQKKIRRTNN